jgi:16S rRNA U516 pseudouridylate synthase RsuA-like enzyme
MRLDRLIGKWGNWGKRRVREQFEAGEVSVNGERIEETTRLVGKFDRVEVSGKVVQAETRRVIILNKPLGVVSHQGSGASYRHRFDRASLGLRLALGRTVGSLYERIDDSYQ